MTTREVAELQVLLEGVPLPAGKQKLIDYASRQENGRVAALLERLPDREFRSLDEVGEELLPVQPEWAEDPSQPREESDLPPGGAAYTDGSAEPGAVRERGPHG